MIKTIWIIPPAKGEINLEKFWENVISDEEMIMIHSSMETANIPDVENIRLHGETLQEKLDDLEEYLENLAMQAKKIRLIVEPHGNVLTDAAVHFCMTHFPLKTEMRMKQEIWRNSDIHGEGEEIYQLVHHLIYLNKYQIAELILKNYSGDNDLFHLLQFGQHLLNGNATFIDSHNELFYFNLLQRVLKSIDHDKEELQFIHVMKGLASGKQRPFIYFLQNYCKQMYKTEELIDFIVLYYRLAEESLLFAMGWDVNDSNYYWVRKNAKRSVPFKRPISRHFYSYLKIILEKAKENPRNKYYQELVRDFTQDWLIGLIDLRHEGISGHGFRHFSKELFEEIASGDPIEKMNELLGRYGLYATHDLFELLQKAILAMARNSLMGTSSRQ
ncbi:MAG: hypothetical protein C0P75_009680 [Bacilli bacterium]|uniref:hypothetical protein n=1 Tax=unclassified Ureibacillus TaxID=2638520 RepID=UPI001ED355DD|nr:hypothetical protein [Bacilli bacterium]